MACLALAIGITLFTGQDITAKALKWQTQMLCSSAQCGFAFELSKEEFVRRKKKELPGPVMPSMIFLACPECSQGTACPAVKCLDCENIFFANPSDNDYPDRCPECGQSNLEAKTMES